MKTEVDFLLITVTIKESELVRPLSGMAEEKSLAQQIRDSDATFFEVKVDDHGPLVFVHVKVIYKNNLEQAQQVVTEKVQAAFSAYLKKPTS